MGQNEFFQIFYDGNRASFGITNTFNIVTADAVSLDGGRPDGNVWKLFVGVVEQLGPSESAIRLYVNSTTPLATNTTSTLYPNNGPACIMAIGPIGNGPACSDRSLESSDQPFRGLVDDVRVFSRALNDDEVALLLAE